MMVGGEDEVGVKCEHFPTFSHRLSIVNRERTEDLK